MTARETPDPAILLADADRVLEAELPWHQLDGATVVVSGAAGFLPACMVEVLLRRNTTAAAATQVIALVRNPAAAWQRFAHHAGNPQLTIIEQDLGRPLSYDGAADVVIHAASPASPKHFGIDPIGTIQPNVAGTSRLLELARIRGCARFLYFSSAEVYGRINEGAITETRFGPLDPLDPRSCYAEAKRMGEALCAAHVQQYGVPVGIVRPFHCYGPGMKLDDGRIFAEVVAAVVEGRPVRLHGDGSAHRAFCYISDAVAGFFTVLLRGEAGKAYNVGNAGTSISIRDLAHIVAGLLPDRQVPVEIGTGTASGYLKSPAKAAMPDCTRLAALGWSPAIGLEEGFTRSIRAHLP